MKKRIVICLLVVFLFLINKSFSQSSNCLTATSIDLSTGSACVNGSNSGAISDNVLYGNCNSSAVNIVWYTYVANGSNNTYTVTPGTMANAEIVIYTGNCPNNAGSQLEYCTTATGSSVINTNWGMTAGEQVWLGIASTSLADGTFQLCVNSTPPLPGPGNTCADAIPICSAPFNISTMNINSSGIKPNCFGSAPQRDIWIKFQITQAGVLAWKATCPANTEYDWALWDITSGCSSRTVVCCNYNFAGGSGSGFGMQNSAGNVACGYSAISNQDPREFSPPINVNCGKIYAIQISNYSNNSDGFSLNFTNSTCQISSSSEFTASPSFLCGSSLTTTINNSSTGTCNQVWSFGDGSPNYVGSSPPSHTYSSPGTYAITASISGPCPSNATQFIKLYGPLASTILSTNATCGNCDGSATVSNVTGGDGIYTYSWSPGGQTTPTISNLCAGNYTCNISNATCGSSITKTITVNTTASATANVSNTGPYCAGSTISLSASGGTSYSWIGPNGFNSTSSSPTISNSTNAMSGVYSVTITVNTCTAAATTSVTINPSPTVAVPTNTTVCAGSSIPAASFTSNPPGATYAWTNSNTAIGLGASGNVNINSFNAQNTSGTPITSTITVTPTLNGCPGTPNSYSISVNPTPVISSVTSQTVCPITNANAINFSGTSGASFDWTNSNTATGLTSLTGTGNIPSFVATNTTTATISSQVVVTPILNGCTGTSQTFTIEVSPPGTISFTMDSVDLTCASPTSGAITITPGGANYNYNWISGPNGYTFTNPNAQNLSNLPEGQYCVEINKPAQLAGIVTIFYENFEDINLFNSKWTIDNTGGPNQFVVNNEYLGGTCTVPAGTAIVADVPNQPAAVTGSPRSNYLHIKATTTTTNFGNTNLICSPAVNFIPQNANYDGIGTRNKVTLNTPLVTTGKTNVHLKFYWIANGESSLYGGDDYGSIEYSLNNGATWNMTGTKLQYQDTWQQADFSETVWDNQSSLLFRIRWQNDSARSVDHPLSIDEFIITASSPSTCPAQATQCATLIAPPINYPTFNQPDSICQGGTINLPSSSNNTTPISGTWSPAVNNQVTTIYTFTPNAGQCAEDTTMEVAVKPIPDLTAITSQAVCAGQTINGVTFASSVSGSTVDWTNTDATIGLSATGNGNINSFTGTNTGTAPITATIAATPTANGCTGVAETFSVTVNPIPSLTAITSQTVCEGETVSGITFITDVTGTVINWTNSETAIGLAASGNTNIGSFTGINNGNSVLQGTISATPSANGCDGAVQTFTISVNPIPSLSPVSSQTICSGQTVNGVTFTSSVSGSTIDWTNTDATIGLSATGNGNINSFTGTNTGTAPITATISATPTASGCDGLPQTFSVTVNPNPTDITSSSTLENCGNADASFSITGTLGGVAPYQYSFNNGTLSNVSSYNNLTAGSYNVSVVDINGCTYSKIITIGSSPGPTGVVVIPINANCGGSDGQISITNTTYASGQTPSPPYQYSFNGQPATSNPNLSNISSGSYTVTVTDANNCSVDSVISIGSNPPFVADFTASQLSGFDSINVVFTNQSTSGANINYYWNFGNGVIDTTTSLSESPSQPYFGVNSYTVTLLVSNGNSLCNDTTSLFIYVDILPFIEIPNVFSPNGDGLNEFFSVKYQGFKNLKMIIFNRWGNKLFETSTPGVGWDGTGASEGTYYYIVTGLGSDNKEFESKGYLTLLR